MRLFRVRYHFCSMVTERIVRASNVSAAIFSVDPEMNLDDVVLVEELFDE